MVDIPVEAIFMAISASVAAANISLMVTSTDNRALILAINRVDNREFPPSSKKLAPVLILSTGKSNNSEHIVTNSCSVSVLAATKCA